MDDRFFDRAIRYWWAFCLIAAVTFANGFLEPYLGYRAVGFVFLITVLIVGFYNSLGPVLFAAALSAITWNLFFIPPRFTFSISNPEDIALCLGYFIAALTTGLLTTRSRELEALANEREQRTQFLYEVVKDILDLSKPDEFIQRIVWRIEELLGGKCRIELGPQKPSDRGEIIEIKGRHLNFGYMVFSGENRNSADRNDLLNSVAQQIGLSLERLQMESRVHEAKRLEESERLHQTLLNSVSHELRTPLTTLMGFASSLREPAASTPEFRKALGEGLSEASERMNRVVSNLLDMSRLSSGALSLHKEWHDVNDLIGVVLHGHKERLRNYKVRVSVADNLPLVQVDFHLMEQALNNLVFNAISYARPKTEILVEAIAKSDVLELSVTDQGPGIPEEALSRIFDKFYRIPGTPPGGTGLGLSIVKNIVDLHSGSICAINPPQGGARFMISLPLSDPPPYPKGDLHD